MLDGGRSTSSVAAVYDRRRSSVRRETYSTAPSLYIAPCAIQLYARDPGMCHNIHSNTLSIHSTWSHTTPFTLMQLVRTTEYNMRGLVGVGNEKHQEHNEIFSSLHVLELGKSMSHRVTTWGKELAIWLMSFPNLVWSSLGSHVACSSAGLDRLACFVDLQTDSGPDPCKHANLESSKSRWGWPDAHLAFSSLQELAVEDQKPDAHLCLLPASPNSSLIFCF